MGTVPQISEAEWEVMKVLWRRSPLTAQEVIDELSGRTDWKPNTVKALLNRLLNKEALAYRAEGKTYYYSPAVSEEECRRSERRSFLQKIYNGATAPMLIHFLQEEKLTKEEIEELKRILSEKE